MTTRADTIARHLNATTLCEADRRLLHLAFLECLGGAAVAGEAAGPWVVAITVRGERRYMYERGPASPDLGGARRWDVWGAADWAARQWGTDYAATVLPLAEAMRLAGAPSLDDVRGKWPGDETEAELIEALKAMDGPATPEPPKPAGWVVRHSGGVVRWLCIRTREGAWPKHEPFATREDAQRIADTTGGEVVPVDAAGNAIEAEDISATLRREECERKAARQAGEEREWEAMRADLDAALTERADLRIALRAVEAERDKLTTDEADLRHALRQIAGMVGVAVALGASTEMHCAVADEVRLVVERLRHAADGMRKLADDMSTRCDAAETDVARLTKERDALAAEVQRSREQKPVRWATVRADGTVAESCWFTEEQAMRDARDYGPTYRAAPLYLAPVVRDHSGVIAQCEEALRESSGLVIATDVMRPALRAALSALRGAS